MIWFLRIYFLAVLAAMLSVTTWASLRQSLLAIPAEVTGNPWFIATMFDAYFGFLAFFIWIAYRERGWLPRVAWFVALMLLGNIAMAIYALVALFRVPATASLRDVLLKKEAA